MSRIGGRGSLFSMLFQIKVSLRVGMPNKEAKII